MRCKIKADDANAFQKILALPWVQGCLKGSSAKFLLISLECTASTPIFELLEIGATVSKEQQYQID